MLSLSTLVFCPICILGHLEGTLLNSSAALKTYSDEELQPQVMIVANDIGHFTNYGKVLDEAGFHCELFSSVSEVLKAAPDRPGTIIFLSWNIKDCDPKAMGKVLAQSLGLECILFAEREDIQTATLLSSCGHPQTIQHPFTEKNFLMAVQTIAKKRREDHERNLRKQRHQERMQAAHRPDIVSDEVDTAPLRFAAEKLAETGSVQVTDDVEREDRQGHLQLIHSEREVQSAVVHHGAEPESGSAELYAGAEQEDALMTHQQGEDQRQKARVFSGDKTASLNHQFTADPPGPASTASPDEEELVESLMDQLESGTSEEMAFEDSEALYEAAEEETQDPAHPLPHEWMNESAAYQPAIDRSGAALSAKDLFWMTTAIAIGIFLCFLILSQVFLSSASV